MIDIWRMAWQNFCRKRFRSLLTVAGIGVGALLITLVSFLGDTGKAIVGAELKSMGLDGISIVADTDGALQEDTLTSVRGLRQVAAAMPLSIQFASAGIGRFSGEVMACGIDAGADQVISLQPLHGRMFSSGDVHSGSAVCVVDEAVALASYGRDNIVGKFLHIRFGDREEAFRVIGVSRAGSSVLQNLTGYMPEMVYMPYTTLQSLTGVTDFDQIAVRLSEGVSSEDAKKQIGKTLLRGDTMGAAYALEDLAAQRDRLNGLMDSVSLILQIISAFSLLVAGMSIMTIMLSSVHERTEEIGVKKAIGATNGRVMAEFLAEAVLLTIFGCGAGMLFAAGLALLGSVISGITIRISPETMLGLFVFSLLLGAVFGVYPAKKAAAMPPVQALGK